MQFLDYNISKTNFDEHKFASEKRNYVEFINCKFDDNVLEYILEFLRETKIYKITIYCCKFNIDDIIKFINNLTSNITHFVYIDKYSCEEINEKISETLSNSKYIKCLEFITNENKISHIYNLFKNPNISYLKLDVPNKNIKFICELLKHNKTINNIRFCTGTIYLDMQFEILNMLQTNNNLESIDIHSDVLPNITLLLQENTRIKQLKNLLFEHIDLCYYDKANVNCFLKKLSYYLLKLIIYKIKK